MTKDTEPNGAEHFDATMTAFGEAIEEGTRDYVERVNAFLNAGGGAAKQFRVDAIGWGQTAVDRWNHHSQEMTDRQILQWAEQATEALTRLLAVARTPYRAEALGGNPRAPAEDDFGDASIGRAMAAWLESGKPLPENKSRLGGNL